MQLSLIEIHILRRTTTTRALNQKSAGIHNIYMYIIYKSIYMRISNTLQNIYVYVYRPKPRQWRWVTRRVKLVRLVATATSPCSVAVVLLPAGGYAHTLQFHHTIKHVATNSPLGNHDQNHPRPSAQASCLWRLATLDDVFKTLSSIHSS